MEVNKYIPFNKPFLTGKELQYIEEAVNTGKISGNGHFTKKCQDFFEQNYRFKKCLLTSSCTDALEMAAMLADIKAGDEVIIPSYTFVSTALAFVRQGATIVFADSEHNHPNIDVSKVESLITPKTKAIVPVHYAGMACDMDALMDIANRHNLIVIEDAAQSIDSCYISPKTGKRMILGSLGYMGTFSFHETKNIISGEGGMLAVNDERFIRRSEIIWEKGTNRAEFFRGEVNKYGWVDIGSSFLPSELISAFLFAQLENLDTIQQKRKSIWNHYYKNLVEWQSKLNLQLPIIPNYATNNAHMFYLIFESLEQRTEMIAKLKKKNISAVFHYLSLHSSPYFKDKYSGEELQNSDRFSDCLLRLPLYYELSIEDVDRILEVIVS